ncbi:PREDICTED: uncharacterized protein LOC105133249 isoform X2 [Populus euphratica]|uniref:Uncharacterized protein LOC105133249 isoform X2 n=1 Tax=Populus euphratica TaxID=75702 RepID=A0AAJ6UT61_POPEU|nr:PREDICTED: uncharacterized protein LOC105133249 isoform X2 [Populus euphratica]
MFSETPEKQTIMASMPCVGNGNPLSMLACIPSTVSIIPRSTKPHLSLVPRSPSLTSCYTRHKLGHHFRPVICASSDRSPTPSRNENNRDSKIVKAAVGASVALACALGIIGGNFRMYPKAIAGPRELYQKAPQVEQYPSSLAKLALESFLDVTSDLASTGEVSPIATFDPPPNPSIEQKHAVRLMINGEAEEAVSYLQKAFEMYKNDPEPAYNVEMALVEILIYQHKYEVALNCDCLNHDDHLGPSDARVFLYKAIIYTMLDFNEKARIWWERYMYAVE